MYLFKKAQQLKFDIAPFQYIVPAIIGCATLCTSLLTWLNDPLGVDHNAWSLPISIGLPFVVPFFSYGLLCICCALYTFVIAYMNWRTIHKKRVAPVMRPTYAGIFYLVLFFLFAWQYLFVDLGMVNHLAQHEVQAIFIRKSFGYNVVVPLVPINPYSWDITTVLGRLTLLADLVGVGPCVMFFGGVVLIESRRLFPKPAPQVEPSQGRRRWRVLLTTGLLVVMGGFLLLGPASVLCEYEAQVFLSTGKYNVALDWLNAAYTLNPSIDQVSYYHVERGEAWYFLHPDLPNPESALYLANTYLQQRDYAGAYAQLVPTWNSGYRPSWLADEMSIVLMQLTQSFRPLSSLGGQGAMNVGTAQAIQATNTPNPAGNIPSISNFVILDANAPVMSVQRMTNDTLAIPWLQRLEDVDPTNAYAQYLTGRIEYDLHSYDACKEQMYRVIQSSVDPDIQSSAYTYIALSDAQQGDYTSSRRFLKIALQFDPAFRNNTAREELSGLR